MATRNQFCTLGKMLAKKVSFEPGSQINKALGSSIISSSGSGEGGGKRRVRRNVQGGRQEGIEKRALDDRLSCCSSFITFAAVAMRLCYSIDQGMPRSGARWDLAK